MTKNEFIQEAALRLITAKPELQMGEIADLARDLAGEFFQDENKVLSLTADEPIDVLLREIDRQDEEGKKKLMEEAIGKGFHWHFQKSGYAEKVRNQCEILGFKYVPNLIGFGRTSFLSQRNIGKKCVEEIDKALLNLYNIKSW